MIVLDTAANIRLLILGLPVFCKFNFIFFEDHSNTPKKKKKTTFFPLYEYTVTPEKYFLQHRVLNFIPHTHTKSGQKCMLNNVIL